MDFVTSATDPWGRPILTGVSWQALWVSIFVGVTRASRHTDVRNRRPCSSALCMASVRPV